MKMCLQSLKSKAEAARQTHSYHAEGASIRFTEELISRMKSCGITRSALAEKIGTSPAYITKILRGDTNFTLDSMVKIAHALECELNFIWKPLAPPATPTRRSPVNYHDTASLPNSILNEKPAN